MNYKQMMWESHHYRFGLAGEGQADVIQQVLEQRGPGLVLNVGCASDGAKVARLASYCRMQIAFDKDCGMVRSAKNTCAASNVVFLAADAYRLPFIGSCADHVVALGLFAYVVDPVLVLREFHRVTRRGGRVMIANSVSRSIELHKHAGVEAGLRLIDETEGYCPAASGEIKRRYLLVFSKD
jgi:ubiquinone/menaquinone biosynthesis C-methylase UbiE